MMVLTPYIAVCFAKFFKPIVVQAKPDNSKFKIQNYIRHSPTNRKVRRRESTAYHLTPQVPSNRG